MNYQSLYKPTKSKFRKSTFTSSNFSTPKNTSNYKVYVICLLLLIVMIGAIKNYISKNKYSDTKKTIVATSKTDKPQNINYNINLPSIDYKTLNLPTKKNDATNINIPSRTAILFDAENSYPLYEKNSRLQVPIASITKIMTAIVALEEYKLDRVATVPRTAANVSGSQMNLVTGEQMTVDDLLYGLMLVSGNDAAYTLASLDPASKNGEIKAFVKKMNNKAKLLGMTDTEFYCPAGLDDRGHSTAYDLAILTSYALKNKDFARISATAQKIVYSSDAKKMKHDLTNANRLVVPTESLYLQSAIGVKTGYTEEAGHSLVGAARENGHTLVSVVLNTNNPAKPESARLNRELLTWGFSSFTWQNSN